jgi:hypothetical protein
MLPITLILMRRKSAWHLSQALPYLAPLRFATPFLLCSQHLLCHPIPESVAQRVFTSIN